MKVNFVHICDYASVSKEGKLSTMGIFDHISVRHFPVTHPLMYLAFEMELVSAELGTQLGIRVALADADGHKMLEAQGAFKVEGTVPPGTPLRFPQIMAFAGVPIPKAGRYVFDIFVNGDHKRGAEYEVAPAPEEATGGVGGVGRLLG